MGVTPKSLGFPINIFNTFISWEDEPDLSGFFKVLQGKFGGGGIDARLINSQVTFRHKDKQTRSVGTKHAAAVYDQYNPNEVI